MNTDPAQPRTRVRVWDLPTRLAHWLLVAGVAGAWWTGETGRLEWHRWCGYLLLGVVLFRVYWGFLGSSTARFTGFVRGPGVVADYLRGAWRAVPGHNPLGALSVLSLLALLATQITLGLFAVDVDGIESGPLSLYVSFDAGRNAAEWHEDIFNVLLLFIGLHIAAIVWYRAVRKEPLVAAMLHGTREYPGVPEPLRPASALRFSLGVALCAAFTWLVTQAFQPF